MTNTEEWAPPAEFKKGGSTYKLLESHPSRWCVYQVQIIDHPNIQYFETFRWTKGTLNGEVKYGMASSLWGTYGFTFGPCRTEEELELGRERAFQRFNDKISNLKTDGKN